ncbi:hypothetical protein, partial [Klebsiella aerogenes]
GGTGGGGDWPPPVRSLHHGKQIAGKLTGGARFSEIKRDKGFLKLKSCKPITVCTARVFAS